MNHRPSPGIWPPALYFPRLPKLCHGDSSSWAKASTINRHDKALAFSENTRQIHWPFILPDTPHLPDSFVCQATVYFSGLISLFSPQRIFHEQESFYWCFFLA